MLDFIFKCWRMYLGRADGECLPAVETGGMSTETRMSGQEVERNLDIISSCLILHLGKLRPRETEPRPQIPAGNPTRLSLLSCFITTWFGKVGSWL